MHRRITSLVVVVVLGLVLSSCNYIHGPLLTRADGPVVLTAGDFGIDGLGLDPDRVVAYRWNATSSSWVQLPVQIDERHVVDFGSQPANNTSAGTPGTVYGTSPIGVTALQYSDPSTWVGADPDATVDADDEVVFMARDAGPEAPAAAQPPAGTIGGAGRHVQLTDPDVGVVGHVYLFYGTAGADPSAGFDLVDYEFVLDGGAYRDDYGRADGPNPESSTVSTAFYEAGFSDRWIFDSLRIRTGNGLDILDGHKSRFSFGTCGRSNATFAAGEGAFVANIDGPVRAIRSYIGANSGPLTQRTEYFYDYRYDQVTDLRVHAIPSVMSFFDWSAAADGMTYRNSEMAAGVTVDGVPDTVPSALPTWEYLSGEQGKLTTAVVLETSISPAPTASAVYVDDSTPSATECWGDGEYHGASGAQFTTAIPNTDPRLSTFETFRARQSTAVWLENMDMDAWAPAWGADAMQPLAATVTDW